MNDTVAKPNSTDVGAMRSQQLAQAQMSDTKVDMFSARGFALAQRIAAAFAASDAVPAQFRTYQLKKVNGAEQWVENPAAMGNCIVAIEVAQAVGMSVTAVMQNADVIEGKLRWSDRFVVAGINASKRFTPLRFEVKNLGRINATYKEKGAWDNTARRYNMVEKSVEIENLQSIAWALPAGFQVPANIYTLEQARTAGLPVIEGPPVSIKLAVEEGWYAKSGSKWQTELKHKMLMMRSGRYFGDIHAPDVVMGIGRTSEEERDVVDMAQQADGTFAVSVDALKNPPSAPAQAPGNVDTGTGEIHDGQPSAQSSASSKSGDAPTFEDAIAAVKADDIDLARDIARNLDAGQQTAIETAIANKQKPESGTRRPRSGASVE